TKHKLVELIFTKFHDLFTAQDRVARLNIVPVEDGMETPSNFSRASKLIDPQAKSLKAFFFKHENIHPQKKILQRFMNDLTHCGLQKSLNHAIAVGRVIEYRDKRYSIYEDILHRAKL